MNITTYIRNIFKPKKKSTLPLGTKIRLMLTEGANIGGISKTGLYYHAIDDYVTITKHSTLVYLYDKEDKIYFKVKNPFVENGKEAPDMAIIYFTTNRFKYHLIYRIL